MSRPLVVALLASATLIGCPKQSPPDPGAPTSAATVADAAPTAVATPAPTASSRVPDEPMPDPITHPCVVTSAQFDVAFQEGDKSCASNADCACIPLRVGSRHACSGVTSKKTLAKLRSLEQEFQKMKCGDTRKCAQSVCQPQCVAGQCQ